MFSELTKIYGTNGNAYGFNFPGSETIAELEADNGLFWLYTNGREVEDHYLTSAELAEYGFEVIEPSEKQRFLDMGVNLPCLETYIKTSYSIGLNPLKGLREKFPQVNWVFAHDPWGKGYDGNYPVILCCPEGIDARFSK